MMPFDENGLCQFMANSRPLPIHVNTCMPFALWLGHCKPAVLIRPPRCAPRKPTAPASALRPSTAAIVTLLLSQRWCRCRRTSQGRTPGGGGGVMGRMQAAGGMGRGRNGVGGVGWGAEGGRQHGTQYAASIRSQRSIQRRVQCSCSSGSSSLAAAAPLWVGEKRGGGGAEACRATGGSCP